MQLGNRICSKRKELGLTQEQVASYLGVSAPAVNKWEHGITCPDIALLCPLARLLKVDVNTLLGYKEDLTEEDINEIVKEIGEPVQQRLLAMGAGLGNMGQAEQNEVAFEDLIEEAFQKAVAKVQEYPNSDALRFQLALTIEGLLILGTGSTGHAKYKSTIMEWYDKCAVSQDEKLRNKTLFMLANKYIAKNDFDKAQEYIDQLPDCDEMDKNVLRINVMMGKEKPIEAAKLTEQMVEGKLRDLQTYMLKLIEIEIQADNIDRASRLADVWHDLVSLLGLWRYSGFVGKLEVAIHTENEEESVKLLKDMIEAMHEPVFKKDCVLYERSGIGEEARTGEVCLPGVMRELEQGGQYDFLRDNKEFQALLNR